MDCGSTCSEGVHPKSFLPFDKEWSFNPQKEPFGLRRVQDDGLGFTTPSLWKLDLRLDDPKLKQCVMAHMAELSRKAQSSRIEH